MTISNLNEMAPKFSKRIENTVGKGEIARYEQFLLFPQCFQKACVTGASKGVIVWKVVNSLPHTIQTFNDPELEGFCKHRWKRKNASDQHLVLFNNVFTLPKTNCNFSVTFILSSKKAFDLNQSKFRCLVKG